MSLQQDQYLQRRADGDTMMTAAATTGIGIAEARLIENDLVRGLLMLPPPTEVAEQPGETRPADGAAASHLQEEKPMARKAANDEVEQIPPPDFDKALKIIRTDLNPLTEQGAKLRGDQSAAWKAIEKDCHLNKKGAKFVHGLIRMDPEIRDDVLRTVYGLMRAAKIGISRDLVDRMGEGEAPTMPVDEEPAFDADDLAAFAAE